MFSRYLLAEEPTTGVIFVEILIAGLVVVLSGIRFTVLADTLATRLNIAGGWIGLILLATVTSLPELVTGGTAVWIGNVDLALGGILGSCSFNIFIIFLLNAMWGGGSVLRGVSSGHALSSSFGLVLIGLGLLGIIVVEKFTARPTLAQTVELIWAVLIFITYLGCIRLLFRFDRANRVLAPEVMPGTGEMLRFAQHGGRGNRMLYLKIGVMAAILIAASWWLAVLGDILSAKKIGFLDRPLGATFVGAMFLAVATSLPEIVTSVAAVRLGNLELALGNIFGSNMFNIFVIPALKVVSMLSGQHLMLTDSGVSLEQNAIVGITAMLLTAIALAGLVYQSRRRLLGRFGLDAILILLTYAGGMSLLLLEAR